MKKTNIVVFIILLLTTFFIGESSAQSRFRAGVVVGGNVSQIRGDFTGGYNKFGLVGGLRVNTILQEKMNITLEIVYSERGSRSHRLEPSDIEINLKYVEVPVLLNYKDWYVEEDDYYRVQVSGGFAYSRLIKGESLGTTNFPSDIAEDFSPTDISFVVGAEYFVTKKFSISGRWYTSINLLYDNEKNNPNLNGLRPHFLSFRMNYFF